MKKILFTAIILWSSSCLAKEEYKYAGVIWDDQKNIPVIFRVLFDTKLKCETELQKVINMNKKVSKINQFFSCSSVFVGIR